MPVIWWGSLAILTACVALRRNELESVIDRFLAHIEDRLDRRIPGETASAPTV
jgi:hypothetical protein